MKQGGKIIFLTSSPDDSCQIQGEWVTGPFTKKNHFLENVTRVWPEHAHVLVITASPDADEQNREMMGYLETVFRESGLRVEELELLDRHTEKYARDWVEESSVLILGGGHVPTQNAFFQEIGLRRLLERFSGVIIGISAGTMNCADLVYAQPELPGETRDPHYRRYIPGLGLTRIQVLPHYDKVKHEKLDGLWIIDEISVADSDGKEFLALPDGSYVLCEGGKETVYGRAYRIADRRLNQVCRDGEAVVLQEGEQRADTSGRSRADGNRPEPGRPQPEPARPQLETSGSVHGKRKAPESARKTGSRKRQGDEPVQSGRKEIKISLEALQKARVRPEVCQVVMDAAENIRANCGIRCTCLEQGHVRAELDIRPEHQNPLGLVYGGILYNLADLVSGVTFLTMGGYGPTISGDMQFINGVRETGGKIICDSRIMKYGHRISFAQADITDEGGRLLARGNYSFCDSNTCNVTVQIPH